MGEVQRVATADRFKNAADVTSLDSVAIQEWLPHRAPFLLVDRVDHIEAGEYAEGVKAISFNEPFFNGHFPGNPVMPGVLMLEAMAQLSCILSFVSLGDYNGQSVYLIGFDNTRFKKMVRPGDLLKMKTSISKIRGNIWCFSSEAHVDGALAVKSNIMAGFDN